MADSVPTSIVYAGAGAMVAVIGTLCTVVMKLYFQNVDTNKTRMDEQIKAGEKAEKLLREQQDIMKGVMTTCAGISSALDSLTKAIKGGQS